jgi:DNA-binding XRE family transcriptional regulator
VATAHKPKQLYAHLFAKLEARSGQVEVSRLQNLIEEQIEQRGEDSIRKAMRLSREQNGITRDELAMAAGVSGVTLQRWEAEQLRLSVGCLAKLWIALVRLRTARSKQITAA